MQNRVTRHAFDEGQVLHHIKHFLPSQTGLKDFIHHNTLHAFQNTKFFDGIFKASEIFGYQVTLQLTEFRELHSIGRINDTVLESIITKTKGAENLNTWRTNLITKHYDTSVISRIGGLRANWKQLNKIDLDNLVQPLFFRVLSNYLDQGVSIWKFPQNNKGFISSLKELEKNSFTSFFKTKKAKNLLLNTDCHLADLLKLIVGKEEYYEQYLFDQQFTHQGWSGLVSATEDFPDSMLDKKIISFRDMIAFELLLEIDALEYKLGNNFAPLCSKVTTPPLDLFSNIESSELHDVLKLWQTAFEWSYYDDVLAGITSAKKIKYSTPPQKTFQALFCIDERECSLRRHIESTDKNSETFGTPGFFSVEFYFQPENGKFYDKLCPAPVTPKYLIKESAVKNPRQHELLYTNKSHTFFLGTIISLVLGFWAGIKLFLNIFLPKMSPAISDSFMHMDNHSELTIENKNPNDKENNLQIGFTIDEMTIRVESLLRSIGLTNNFAPLVYVVAHGSSSANNPHHSAHDCGACSGRPGSVNAKVFAFMVNHPKVREQLKSKGIDIPSETQFIGSLHDTAADQIAFYDERVLTSHNRELHLKNKITFETALDLNAKERSRRFASIKTKNNLEGVRKAILDRSVSMFEPRPELGHGTNSLCIIGGRDLTKNLFLDRRAFLNSFDYKSDPDGKILMGVMKPVGLVCGGINLEYYFSRVDNHKLGAGTKLPHNVVGLFGVANSSDGDLRPGLPVQMIEVHDPVRLLVIVEHFPDVVLKVIQSTPDMYEWYINEWIHLVAIHPETNQFYYLKEGKFNEYNTLNQQVPEVKDIITLVESAKEMETNYIVDATKENLPVYTLQ
ncbi:MAG: DUF2309 domain-containing protein [Sphingobacteriaceae bacterium]|nr:DUF2309 domain-containing protein [Sphingobacteriaceae bacterium]